MDIFPRYQEVKNRLPKSKNIFVTLEKGKIIINIIEHTFKKGMVSLNQLELLKDRYELIDTSKPMDNMSCWIADKLIRLCDAMPSQKVYINVCKSVLDSKGVEEKREKGKDEKLGEFIDKNFRDIVNSMWKAGKDIRTGESLRKEKTGGYVIKSKCIKAPFNLRSYRKCVEERERKMESYLGGGKVRHLKENGLVQFYWIISKEELEDIDKGIVERRSLLEKSKGVKIENKAASAKPKKINLKNEIPSIVNIFKARLYIDIPGMLETGSDSVVLKSEVMHSDTAVDKESKESKWFIRSLSNELRTGLLTMVKDSCNEFHVEWKLTPSHIPFLTKLGLIN